VKFFWDRSLRDTVVLMDLAVEGSRFAAFFAGPSELQPTQLLSQRAQRTYDVGVPTTPALDRAM
jgi:hypothetical protein